MCKSRIGIVACDRAEIIQKIVCDFYIILLHETHLKEDEEIALPGHTCLSPMGQKAVGLVMYLKQECMLKLVEIKWHKQ